ncbi:MAG: hypothetical protein GF349_04515 [Candidatus Magasanikbacteria bacterium]|nr:hypothetical protein [Candidatus Magasanikbacteria bacterium]
MTFRQYLFSMLLSSSMCWAAWVLVIMNINPFETNWIGFMLFYTSLFLALFGTISIFILAIYYFLAKNVQIYKMVKRSFRDSLFLSAILVILLFLQGKGLLSVLNFTVFILILVLTLTFIYSTKKSNA